MEFRRKIICIAILLIMLFAYLIFYFVYKSGDEKTVMNVVSPMEFVFDDGEQYLLRGVNTFSADYTENNKELSALLGITEDEAFILGNLGKYWAKNLVGGRKVQPIENDLIYYKFKYLPRLKNSPFAFENGKPTNVRAFERQLSSVRKGKFVILDLDKDIAYPVSKLNREKVTNFVIVRKSHVKDSLNKSGEPQSSKSSYSHVYKSGDIKIIVSDLTTKIKPDRECSSEICKEIVENINLAKNTIDIAIYGYSSTPAVEQVLIDAIKRGVKVRLIYDTDANGGNIYPDTVKLMNLIPDNTSDKHSPEVRSTMHNKFYVFDGKTVITGSANLSHTDMSGYNSNAVIVINSKDVADFYTQEFNQMYSGKFHNEKGSVKNKSYNNIKIFFSPQDKAITNAVLPLIRGAKEYIYIPAFVITEKRVTAELISAKQRGVDVRVIADALNASTQHSKHKELRAAEVLVKAENYAGKMHSKSMIVDDEYVVIGSMNFSNSGENRNDENLVVLKDSSAAKFYKEFFIYQWNKIPDKWLKYTPRAESWDSIGSCTDGIDNNYDGKTDSEDIGCRR